ncbi:MAG: hypothetical protein M3Q40_04550 [Pseudomonadota bacterium]|nr:hypothetical protein [Pseudomonadota bacterium]
MTHLHLGRRGPVPQLAWPVLNVPVTTLPALVLSALLVLVSACRADDAQDAGNTMALPADAVMVLAQDLRRDDLQAYARHALPPALHAQMQVAWSQGRTIWPLTQLPLDQQVPAMVAALAEPGASEALTNSYKRQFAGAHSELKAAASTMGLFAAQYVNGEESYSEQEREHLLQVIAALTRWGQKAPLGDPQRAREAIPRLVAAARATGLASPEAFASADMSPSLQRLGPFFAQVKRELVAYGLDLDSALDSLQATLLDQTGDSARVRLRYTLAGSPIDAVLLMERHDGRWYLSDTLRHAREQAAPAVAEAAATASGAAPESVGTPSDGG